MAKIIIVVVVLVLFFPLVMKLMPKPLVFSDVRDALEKAGFTVTNYGPMNPPELGAKEHVAMQINGGAGAASGEGASVNLYRFDDRAKLDVQMGYQQEDPGQAMAESTGLRQQLGAAEAPPRTVAARKGKVMITVTSKDHALIKRILDVFRQL